MLLDNEHITAAQIVELEDKAKLDSEYQAVLRTIFTELKKYPQTEERLVFEFLDLALDDLAIRRRRHSMLTNALFFHRAITLEKLPDYITQLENVSLKCFELLSAPKLDRGLLLCVELTLGPALIQLRRRDPERFAIFVRSLKLTLGEQDKYREKLLDKIVNMELSDSASMSE